MLARYLEQVEQSKTPLALIMCDLDHFKQINDNWGHAVGDQALVQFATVLQSQCRLQDLVARIGGEEFIVLLPGHLLETATSIAERLRKSTVRATPKDLGQRWLTASFGVAQAVPGEAAAELLQTRGQGPLPGQIERSRLRRGGTALSADRRCHGAVSLFLP